MLYVGGHQRTGSDGCAEDILNEIDVANSYYKYVISGLKKLGHEVLDVTPPENNRSLSNSLMYGVNEANEWGADYFISCHANSSNRTSSPVGCEVIYNSCSQAGYSLAVNVDKQLALLGFRDRGAKADVRGLCELRKTSAPAIIIEPFFISSSADCNLYQSIGAEAIGNAIVKGLTGQTVASSRKFGWNQNETGWWYCTDVINGYYYKDCWKKIKDKWFSFDPDGYARQNVWLQDQGHWYYLDEECEMVSNTWKWINSACYYFNEHGELLMNCKTPDGYYVDDTGAWIESKK